MLFVNIYIFILDVKFDLAPHISPTSSASLLRENSYDDVSVDTPPPPAEISLQSEPTKDWELDVRGLVSTKKWLQNYGLKKNRMDMHSLLPQIGFKHADGIFIIIIWKFFQQLN